MARALTDEEKKARAEARKAAKEAKEAEAREDAKKEENNEIELLKARNEMLMKQMEALMAGYAEAADYSSRGRRCKGASPVASRGR